jgi:hypothetical protein
VVCVFDSTRTWGGGLILVSLMLSMNWLAMVLGQSSRVERLRRLWCRGKKENLLLFDIDAATHRFSHPWLCPGVCMMVYSTRSWEAVSCCGFSTHTGRGVGRGLFGGVRTRLNSDVRRRFVCRWLSTRTWRGVVLMFFCGILNPDTGRSVGSDCCGLLVVCSTRPERVEEAVYVCLFVGGSRPEHRTWCGEMMLFDVVCCLLSTRPRFGDEVCVL